MDDRFYTTGEYIEHNPTLHEEDSAWKTYKLLPFVDKFLKENTSRKASILDVGGGAGLILKAISEHIEKNGRKVQQYALDLSAEMLKVQKKNNPRAKMIQGNIKKTTFADKQFDLALMIDVLEHIPQPEEALKELQRISKYAIFKVPLESNLHDKLMNFATKGRHRKRIIESIGHINVYNYGQLKRQIEECCGRVVEAKYTNAFYYYATSLKNQFNWRNRMLHNIALAMHSISPALSSRFFTDFTIMLAKNNNQEYSTKEHWEEFWKGIELRKNYKPSHHFLLSKLLQKNEKWKCFEIGCVPGKHLLYFYENYGYKPTGIDFSERIESVREYFRKENIPVELHKGDFFEFKTDKKYNVVVSHGFVEHFGNPELMFKKHIDLLAKGGFLIISMPNFRNLQYYIHNLFDWKTLKTHNFDVMRPELWRKLAEKNKLKIHYCNYFETFDYWVNNQALILKPFTKTALFAARALRFLLKRLKLNNIPNKYISPHILLIAQK